MIVELSSSYVGVKPKCKIHEIDCLKYGGRFHDVQEKIYFGRQVQKNETLIGLTEF